MTEPSSADAEAPIDDIGDELPTDENTDNSEAPVFEDDKLEDFNPHDNEGWPDDPPRFEAVAFRPEPPLDEGVK
jgi:hypothetical protein